MFDSIKAKLGVLVSPASEFGKAIRDAFWLAVASGAAVLVNDTTGIIGGLNDALFDGKAPAVLIVAGSTGALYVFRKVRSYAQGRSNPAPSAPTVPPSSPS